MNDPLAALWHAFCSHLQSTLTPDAFHRWFAHTRLVSADELKLTIAVPNQIYQFWIESNYSTALQDVCLALLGTPRRLSFLIDSTLTPASATRAPQPAPTPVPNHRSPLEGEAAPVLSQQSGWPSPSAAPSPAQPKPETTDDSAPAKNDALNYPNFDPAPILDQERATAAGAVPSNELFNAEDIQERTALGVPAVRSYKGGSTMNVRYQFDGFVPGPANQFAYSTAIAVAEKPGRVYNPLFIHGKSGLGKSHLLQAIAFHLISTRKKAKVIYVTTEDFTNEFIDAVQMGQLTAFRKKYRTADALLIDDIHFLAGKERSQEEFFHTFNALSDGQRQIVLSSDRPASEVARLESRLVTRCEWGIVAEVGPPDLETRLAILRKKMIHWRSSLPDEWVRFIAERITNNIRRLEGALMRLASFVSMGGPEAVLTLPRVEELLKDLLQEENRVMVTVDLIQRVVADHFDIRLADMSSKRRPANIAFPRQVAMTLARDLTRSSYAEIGHAFGGRDHGTVMHAVKLVNERVKDDPQLRSTMRILEAKIKSA